MLRKLVAVTGAVILAVGLGTASAVASDMPELSVANRGHGSKPPLAPTPDVPTPDTGSPPPDDSGPGGPPAESAPPPPAMPPAVPTESPTTVPPPPPEEVRPVEKVRLPAASEEAPTRLPQTGTGARPLTATGGASLLGAGLAVIAGARQKRRAATRPGPRR